jgi:hypothetical protein
MTRIGETLKRRRTSPHYDFRRQLNPSVSYVVVSRLSFRRRRPHLSRFHAADEVEAFVARQILEPHMNTGFTLGSDEKEEIARPLLLRGMLALS